MILKQYYLGCLGGGKAADGEALTGAQYPGIRR